MSPVGLAVLWAVVAVVDGVNEGPVPGSAIVAAVASVFFAVAMFWVAVGFAIRWRIGSLALCAVLTILLFSQVYHLNGIGHTAPEHVRFWQEAVYFSIVTWATLGYGDIEPTESMRLIAAVEAVLGYLYMGLIIAVLVQLGVVSTTRGSGVERGSMSQESAAANRAADGQTRESDC